MKSVVDEQFFFCVSDLGSLVDQFRRKYFPDTVYKAVFEALQVAA